MNENEDLIARARKSYRSLDGVVVVSPRLIKDLADALESLPTYPAAGAPERDALAEKLSFLLWDRGNSVNEWPHDEAEAYREFGWAEGVAAARKIMFQNAADDLISAGYRRQPEPREVTTVEELDALPEYVVVFDRVHGVARKLGHEWSLDGMNGWWPSEQLEIRYGLPLTILFTPSTEETP